MSDYENTDEYKNTKAVLERYKHIPMVKRMYAPGYITPGTKSHPDYPRGSHRMGTVGVDGKEWAYPELVEKDGKLVKQDPVQTVREGNAIPFKTFDEADAFAHGSWKKVLKGKMKTYPPRHPGGDITQGSPEDKNKPDYKWGIFE